MIPKKRSSVRLSILKRITIFIFLFFLFSSSDRAFSEPQWYPLSGASQNNLSSKVETKSSPIYINVSSPNPSIIRLTIQLPGLLIEESPLGDGSYVTIDLPQEGLTDEVGKPQLPQISRLIAIPDQAELNDIRFEIIELEQTTMENIKVLPVPRQELRQTQEGLQYFEPMFEIDNNTYSQNTFYPANPIKVEGKGAIREQTVTFLKILPVQYNPVQNKLMVIKKISINILLPEGSVHSAIGAGPFNDMLKKALLNANPNPPQEPIIPYHQQPAPETRVHYYHDLHNTASKADYIIIASEGAYSYNGPFNLYNLALHRVIKNNFDVAIIDINDIYEHFPYPQGQEVNSITDFLTYAYNNWQTGSLPYHFNYAVIVGDADPDRDTPYYAPTYEYYSKGYKVYSDKLFTFINDLPGDPQLSDFFIGRLPADSDSELQTVIRKIIEYEGPFNNNGVILGYRNNNQGPVYNWQKSLSFWCSFDANGDANRGLLQTSYYTFETIENIIKEQNYFSTKDKVYVLDPYYEEPTYGPYWDITQNFNTTLNEQGRLVVLLTGHGYSGGLGNGKHWYIWHRDRSGYPEYIPEFNNANHLPFVLASACSTAHFGYIDLDGEREKDCVAESTVVSSPQGAIGWYGASMPISFPRSLWIKTYEALLKDHIYNIGLLMTISEINSYNMSLPYMVLMGDPALTLSGLGISSGQEADLHFSKLILDTEEDQKIIRGSVANDGLYDISGVHIKIYRLPSVMPPQEELLGEITVDVPFGEIGVSFEFAVPQLFHNDKLKVEIDPENAVSETDEDNNIGILTENYLRNWPISFLGNPSGYAIADLDEDGYAEIIVPFNFHFDCSLNVFRRDGSLMSPWPKTLSGKSSTPIVVDIDKDGMLDIVVAINLGDSTRLTVLDREGNELPGWSVDLEGILSNEKQHVAVGDIDGDGDLEIVAHFSDKIFAFNHDGMAVEGWPVTLTESDFTHHPVLADIDEDGRLDILLSQGEKIYAFNGDGVNLPGWPVNLPWFINRDPAVGDIDADGHTEVVVTTLESAYIYVFRQDGSIMENFPVRYMLLNPLAESYCFLADLKGDGKLEIVVGGVETAGWKVYMFDYLGQNVDNWPVDLSLWGNSLSLTAGDLNGDNIAELIIVLNNSVHIYNANAQPLVWPTGISEGSSHNPVLGDIDNDGDIDIIFAARFMRKLYAIDPVKEKYSAGKLVSPMVNHDRYNSSNLSCRIPLKVPQQYSTIQSAINSAMQTEYVKVSQGIYNEEIQMKPYIDVIGNSAEDTAIFAYYEQLCAVSGAKGSLLKGFKIYTYPESESVIFCRPGADMRIEENLIVGNNAEYVISINDSYPKIINNTISDNNGTAIAINRGSPFIQNNIISGNNEFGIAKYTEFGLPQLYYNDVWNNTEADYLNLLPGDYDIQLDPEFTQLPPYHLSISSPCIDAGDPTSPPDPDDTIADMGAFYYEQ